MTKPENLLTFAEVMHRRGVNSRTSVYRDIEEGRLPQPVKVGRRSFFPESEVDAHIAALIAERDARHCAT